MSNKVIHFDKWFPRFERKSKKAFAVLDELKKYGDEIEFKYLKRRITKHCYEAVVYDQIKKTDGCELARSFSEEREKAIKAIRVIKEFINEYPREAGENFGTACDRYRIKCLGDNPKDWMSHNFNKFPLSSVFEEYEKLLNEQKPGGIMSHGVFHYDSPVNARTNLPDNSVLSLIC